MSLPPGASLVSGAVPLKLPPGASLVGSGSAHTNFIDPNEIADQIKANPFRVLQIPFEQLGAQATQAHDELAQKLLSDAAKGKKMSTGDYVKTFLLGTAADASRMVGGSLSPKGVGIGVGTALAPEVAGPLLVLHGGYTAAANAPDALRGKPDAVQAAAGGLAEAAGGGVATAAAIHGATPIQEAWKASRYKLQRLSGAMQTPQEAAKVPPGSQFAPPRAISNQNVIDHATSEGIDLTPAQATRDRVAQFVQGIGEQTVTPGGEDLRNAMEANKGKLAQSIENFAMRHDPHVLGSSPEAAGGDLQSQAKIAMEVAKDNAAIAYKQAGIDQANIAVDVKTPLQKFVDAERNVRQPGAAVSQSEYKSPAVEAALKDIESKISDQRLGPNASVQSARNLRTEFWEKANDYSGNIPDAARRIYAKASEIPDNAMMNAAKGTPFEQSFRDASQQWADLKAKFDTPGEPFYKLLQSSDPKQAYNAIVGSKSAADIMKLKQEGVDLAPIQGQVIRDIANKNFRVNGNTLAGYPDSFLQQLFGTDGAKELYVKSEIGRRLNLEANPSGSGRILIARDQLGWNPANWVKGESAAQISMPRNPSSFVSPTASPRPSWQSLSPKSLAVRGVLGSGSAGAGGVGQ